MQRYVKRYLLISIIAWTCLFTSAPYTYAKPLTGFVSGCLDAKMGGADAAELLIIPGKNPRPNEEVFLFMCSGKDNVCGASSTDGSDLNLKLFGVSRQRATEEQAGIEARGGIKHPPGSNPNWTTANGLGFRDSPVIWHYYTKYAIPHRFYWVQPAVAGPVTTPVITLAPGEEVVAPEAGNQGGLQLAQVGFGADESVPTPVPTGTSGTGKKCASLQWDPRGYVFDAETLNPVQNVTVTLYQKDDKTGEYSQVPQTIGVFNPFTTTADSGSFNFFVNPGTYKMTIDPKNARIADQNQINPEYTKILTDENGDPHLYTPDADIKEVAGKVAVAHIPVQIRDRNLLIRKLSLIMKDEVLQTDTNTSSMELTGTVSHPKSRVTIVLNALTADGTPVDLPPQNYYTNEFGEYDVLINQNIPPLAGKPRFLQNIHVKIELNEFFQKQGNDTTPIEYDVVPLPHSVEGLAYDKNGAPIPNAVVGIYPNFSENPMAVVVADEVGKFQIDSDQVPQWSFTLRYKKSNGEIVVVNSTDFLEQNIGYYVKNNINPYKARHLSDDDRLTMQNKVDRVVSQKDVQALNTSFGGGSKNRASSQEKSIGQPPTQSNAPILLGVVLITMILCVGIVLFLKKRKATQQPT